ncbi:PREDICTED: protein HIDE1 isoform X2 [Mandrillus leucophaeus]|uniref:protein HIDE1 isoform X2 n=1 Tax=Mandrillus leucophaeus TaxID=9568 RepID=UPI0005F4879A|nr:PREDICTED: protein HIDE1 isoform X2 [Mandrillus leucophaeus]
MPWTILLLAAGSLAIPRPSIRLVPPHPSNQEDPIHIACMAPGNFLGANFTLYRGGQVVQILQAHGDQRGVTFNLNGSSSEAPFHCQYGVLGELNQPQLSDLSEPVNVSFPVPTWILVLSLSLAGAVFLLAGLVAVVLVVRRVKLKNLQKKSKIENPAGPRLTSTAQTCPSITPCLPSLRKRCQKKTRPPWMITQAPLPPPATPGPGRDPLLRPPHLRSRNSALSGPVSEAEVWGPPPVSRHSGT